MNPKIFARAILVFILTVLVMAIITSCGTVKKVKQTHKIDSSAKTETVTKRKVDTTIRVPQTTVTGEKPVDNLIKGDSLVTENDQIRISVQYDPTTGSIRAKGTSKPREIPVKLEEEIRTVHEVEVKKQDEVKEKEPRGLLVVGGFLTVCLLIFCILLALLFKRK